MILFPLTPDETLASPWLRHSEYGATCGHTQWRKMVARIKSGEYKGWAIGQRGLAVTGQEDSWLLCFYLTGWDLYAKGKEIMYSLDSLAVDHGLLGVRAYCSTPSRARLFARFGMEPRGKVGGQILMEKPYGRK